MNFYKHHLGDYAADTAHLSWDEDCAYRRLLDAYYKREQPIPADLKDACRLARAQTPSQRKAVEAVLREFFELEADGWHQKRCDRVLAEALDQGADREARADNERERQRRHREERKALFQALRERNTVPAWDTKTEELRALLARGDVRTLLGSVTPDVTHGVTPPVTPVTRDVTRTATANQKPLATSHKPITKPQREQGGVVGSRIDPGWRPSADGWDTAKASRPDIDVEAVTATFVDHFLAQADDEGLCGDWEARWRIWIRKERPAKVGTERKSGRSDWRASEEGIKRAAVQHGVASRAGESWAGLAERVSAEIEKSKAFGKVVSS